MIRPTDDLFDPRIADWLEEDPTRAPVDLLDDVLRAAPAIQQRPRHRFAWATRQRIVTPVAFAAGVAFAVVASLALFGRPTRDIAAPSIPPPVSLPAPSTVGSLVAPTAPAQPPSAPPNLAIVPSLTKRFTSPTYGYSIAIKPSWTTSTAALPWSGPDNSDPVVDHVDFIGTDSGMTGASQALAPGQTFDDWLARFGANNGGGSPACTGGDPSTWPPVQVGDAVGRWQQMCNAAEVVVQSGGRAYAFTWESGSFDQSRHLSPDDYKAVLTTIRFDPESVPPSPTAPPLTRSFTSNRNGFSIKYPAGWTATQATTTWRQGTTIDYGNPALDVIQSKTQRFDVASQPLLPGQTADDWIRWYCHVYQSAWVDCDQAIATWPTVAVGDATGLVDVDGNGTIESVVESNGRVFDVVVVKGARAYGITLDGLVDRATLEALLGSMTLTPETAVDASPSPT